MSNPENLDRNSRTGSPLNLNSTERLAKEIKDKMELNFGNSYVNNGYFSPDGKTAGTGVGGGSGQGTGRELDGRSGVLGELSSRLAAFESKLDGDHEQFLDSFNAFVSKHLSWERDNIEVSRNGRVASTGKRSDDVNRNTIGCNKEGNSAIQNIGSDDDNRSQNRNNEVMGDNENQKHLHNGSIPDRRKNQTQSRDTNDGNASKSVKSSRPIWGQRVNTPPAISRKKSRELDFRNGRYDVNDSIDTYGTRVGDVQRGDRNGNGNSSNYNDTSMDTDTFSPHSSFFDNSDGAHSRYASPSVATISKTEK